MAQSAVIIDNEPGQFWLVYIRCVSTGRREVIRTQMPHLVMKSDNWWITACLPEGRKTVIATQRAPI